MKTYLLIISALLMACSNPKMDAEKQTINQLQSQYDSLLVVTKAIDIQSASDNLKKYKEAIKLARKR